MMVLTRTLEQNRLFVYAALLVLLGLLLVLSPSEVTLGNVVKIVYLHGALERVSAFAYLGAGALGLAQLAFRRAALVRWTQAMAETAIGLWLAQILVSLPAQILAWGGITWTEPRVNSAVWFFGLTLVVYAVARWMNQKPWLSLAAATNALVVLLILRGTVNILHPLSPIVASDSLDIKVFYAAIVLTTAALALLIAWDRGRHLAVAPAVSTPDAQPGVPQF